MPPAYDFSRLGTLGTEKDFIRRQIEQATALRNKPASRFSTWGGQLAGSLGDIVGSIAGGVKERQLGEALKKNREAEQGALGDFNTAIGRPGASPEEMEQLAYGAISSGHPTLSKTGEAMLETQGRGLTRAMQAERDKKAEAERAADNARADARDKGSAEERAIDNARADASLKSTQDFQKWQMAHPQTQILETPGGIVGVNTRDPTQTPLVVPSPDGSGKPLQKLKELSTQDKKDLQEVAQLSADVNSLTKTFKPEFVGGGWAKGKLDEAVDTVGSGGGLAGQLMGAVTGNRPEFLAERGDWHRKYAKIVDLPERKGVFGSSLSGSEKQSWANAADVVRGGNPEKSKVALEWMAAKYNEKMEGLKGSLVSEGASPTAVDALTHVAPLPGGTPSAEPAPAQSPKGATPGLIRMQSPKGKVFEVDPSEVAAAEAQKWKRL